MPRKRSCARRSMPRKELRLRPDEGARRWLIKKAKKEFWRVARWYTLADLIQDGYLCYAKVRKHYPEVTDRPHIMSLFMRTFDHYIVDLTRTITKQVEEEPCEDIEALMYGSNANTPAQGQQVRLLGNTCPETEMAHMVIEAPDIVRKLLKTILANPEILNRPQRRAPDGTHEPTNNWLCGMIGANPDETDLYSMLDEHLRAAK